MPNGITDASADKPRPVIVLLSGGLDSATVLSVARRTGAPVHALSFRYGQKHVAELACATAQAERQAVARHEIIDLSDLGRVTMQASALLAGSPIAVPKDVVTSASRSPGAAADIPDTYVPARNLVFLSVALAYAESIGSRDLWIGVNAMDYSGYPDCRPDFLVAFEKVANVGTRVGIGAVAGGVPAFALHAPLLYLRKHEIIRLGLENGVDYAHTMSCYDPVTRHDGDKNAVVACGACDSCRLRLAGFEGAGAIDPVPYRSLATP